MVKVLPTKLASVIPATMIIMASLCAAPKAIGRTTENNRKETAELSMGTTNAIKAMVSPQISSTQTTYNRQLHDTFLKYASSPEDIAFINEYEKDCYKYGPYAGAALMELGIIESTVQTYVDKDTKCMDRINPKFGKDFKEYNGFHPDNEIAKNKDKIMDNFYKGTDYIRYKLESPKKNLSKGETLDIIYNAYKDLGINNKDIENIKSYCKNMLEIDISNAGPLDIALILFLLHEDIAKKSINPYVYSHAIFSLWYNVAMP